MRSVRFGRIPRCQTTARIPPLFAIITGQVLTVQLRQLEADGVMVRTVYPEIPARVEYSPSDLGRDLSKVMDELEIWGARHQEAQERQRAAAV